MSDVVRIVHPPTVTAADGDLAQRLAELVVSAVLAAATDAADPGESRT